MENWLSKKRYFVTYFLCLCCCIFCFCCHLLFSSDIFFIYLPTTLIMPNIEIKNANPVSPRNIHGFVSKRPSKYFPTISASTIGPAIHPETCVNISTPGFHQEFPVFKFCLFSSTKTKPKRLYLIVI